MLPDTLQGSTCTPSMRALLLWKQLVFGFITGRRWQTAASCKESCIWDGKALLAAPCLSLSCMEPLLQSWHLHLLSHLCPECLGCGTAGTGIELVSLPAPGGLSGLLSPPQGLAPTPWTSLVSLSNKIMHLSASIHIRHCALLPFDVHLFPCSLSLALFVTFLSLSPKVEICTLQPTMFKNLFRLC